MRYRIEIANKILFDRGGYDFAMSKEIETPENAQYAFTGMVRDYGEAVYIRLVDLKHNKIIRSTLKVEAVCTECRKVFDSSDTDHDVCKPCFDAHNSQGKEDPK